MSRLMPRWTTLAITLSVAAALLVLAACGGDDDDKTTVTPTLAPGQTAAPTAEPTEDSGDDGGDDISDEDIAAQLEALGENIDSATGKVTYTDTSIDGEESTFIVYSKSPNSRFDTVDADGSTSIYIQTPDASYSCSSFSGTEDCIQTAGADSSSGLGIFGGFFSPAIIQAMVIAAEAEGIEVDKSEETIAGADATCFEGTESGETTKFCFSESGVLLLTQTTDADGTSGMVATAYSEDVSDSDFEPPYPVSTIVP